MQRSFIGFVGFVSLLASGCSDGSGADCPPEYPVERDGFCYRATDGGLIGMDGAPGLDGAVASDDGGGGEDDGGPGSDGSGGETDGEVICMGEHPNVMATRRYCDPGSCYCGDAEMGLDACYVEAVAEACCPVDVVCEPASGSDGGGVICMAQHPLVEGDRRYCEPGSCYCGDLDRVPPLDACYDASVAEACCPVAVVCG